ncbi:DedA family protein [Tessaracoccus sp. MC1865]|uniref:DedA family protein n=1 Tax=Tessaracoccus sp. MC1865 TaxID=2760310 RepID=UPI001AE654D0|nr:DedA family protein [Tessaracoccus sp. MC1865]QTO38006.1 DedA family protein [Tessaracoccus sp. MC1865]
MIDEPKSSEEPRTEQWWQDQGMPWRKEPGRADYWCLGWFGFIGLFSLVLLPTRAWLITAAPDWLAMLTGGRTAVAVSGALGSQGDMPHWPVVLLVASIFSLKFDWVYWWAGKLWGRGIIEVWAGQSKRAQRNYARAERWAEKLGPLGFLVAYFPIPLPLMQVVFVLSGATNMSLRRFLVYDYIASTLWLVLYFWLGWRFGAPIVDVLELYARIGMWVALGLIVFVIFTSVLAQRRRAKPNSGEGA